MTELVSRRLRLEPDAAKDKGTQEVAINPESTSVPASKPPYRVPFFIFREQAYYWTREWQEGIRRSMADLEAGNYTDYGPDDPGAITRRFVGEED